MMMLFSSFNNKLLDVPMHLVKYPGKNVHNIVYNIFQKVWLLSQLLYPFSPNLLYRIAKNKWTGKAKRERHDL